MTEVEPLPAGTKTVLITGCSPGGIGHALARAFNAKGVHTFATARTEKALEDLKALGIEPISLEVTSGEQIIAARRHVEQRTGGRLDILVNNAGRNYAMPAIDVDLDEARDLFETNVMSVMRMCKEFSPLLIRSRGTIVNIGSLAGEIPYAFGSVYNASKAALHSYSDSLRVELIPFEVRVMVVVTGGVTSNISRTRRSLPNGSFYSPMKDDYRRRQGHSQQGAMDNETYADGVVKAALGSSPPRSLWRGHHAWSVWFLLQFMPRWFWDTYFFRMLNLNKLVRYYKANPLKRD